MKPVKPEEMLRAAALYLKAYTDTATRMGVDINVISAKSGIVPVAEVRAWLLGLAAQFEADSLSESQEQL